jgi:antitoxin Phd
MSEIVPCVKLAEGRKASLSSLIDDAVRGEPSIITRHGKPEAVVVGFEEWGRLTRVPSFGRLLMSAPLAAKDLPPRSRKSIRRVKL